jgi:hypothetical protein
MLGIINIVILAIYNPRLANPVSKIEKANQGASFFNNGLSSLIIGTIKHIAATHKLTL